MSPSTGRWSSGKITLGALGDSFYEYLIKQWLVTKKKVPYLREMFDSAMLSIARKLVQRSHPSGYVYIADWNGQTLTALTALTTSPTGMVTPHQPPAQPHLSPPTHLLPPTHLVPLTIPC